MQNKKNNKLKTGGVFDCWCDSAFTLIRADESLFNFMGYTREEFKDTFNNQFFQVIYQEEQENILEEIDRQVSKDGVFMYENRLICKDGSLKWIWISAQLIKLEHGERLFHCIFHDIEEEKHNQEQLMISKKRLEYILAQTQDIFFEYDCLSNEVYYSDTLKKKFGYTIPATNFPNTLFTTNIIHSEDEQIVRNAFQSIRQGKDYMDCQYRLRYRDKGYRWVRAKTTALHDESGKLIKIVGIISDIHDQKQEILKSKEEAALDPLTGLLNRRECLRRLDNYIAVSDDLFAFILIDIDDFKLINDMYGHSKGDEVLKGIGEELKSIIRVNDIAARVGGDEFIVCLMNLPNFQVAIDKAQRIQEAFVLFLSQKLACEVKCSIGISFYPNHGSDYEKLLEHADKAMYQAKREGKNQFRVFVDDDLKQDYIAKPQKYMKKTFHDHVIEYVMRILLENPNKETAILKLLKLVGNIFDCNRITIYERQDEQLLLCHEWVSSEVYQLNDTTIPIIKRLQRRANIIQKTLAFANVDKIDDNIIREWFIKRQTIAAIACTIRERNEITMAVCFEDCQTLRNECGEERYTLQMISEIIHLFLRDKQ